jgi:hypothetical protein
MHLAEVVPAGGAAVTVEALTGLLLLCGLIVALGMIKFVVAIVDALLYVIHKVVHRVPIIGPSFTALAHRAAAKITNALAHAELAVDEAIGWTWHNMAHLIRWTVREIEQLSYGLLLNAIAMQLHISRRQAAKLIQAFLHPIRTLQLIERRLLHALRAAEAATAHTVGSAVLPRIHAGEAALDRVIEWDIPRLRARARRIERRLDRLWHRIRARPWLIASAAMAGVVALSLRRLGLDWIRCRGLKRRGPLLCRLPIDLLKFLASTGLGIFAFSQLCQVVERTGEVAARVLPPLIEVLAKPAAALCDGKHHSAPALPLDTSELPPVADPLPL